MNILFLLLSLFLNQGADASVCCGTSTAGVSTIQTQSEWSMDVTYGLGDVSTIVDQNGYWRRTREISLQTIDMALTAKVNSSYLIRGQTGLQQRQLGGVSSSTLMTDFTLDLITPINDTNSIFARMVAPTGRSSFEGNYTLAEVSGRGYFQAGLGWQWQKRITDFSILNELEIHQGIDRRISGVNIRPGYGLGASGLLRWQRWKLEPYLSARLIYESPAEIRDQFPHSTSFERSVISSLGLNWRFASKYELGLGYSTQRWLGVPVNSALVNMVTLQLTALELPFNRQIEK